LIHRLLDYIGREHKNLEPEEEFILLQGFLGVIAILPFALWRLVTGDHDQGFVDLSIVTAMVIVGFYVLSTGRYRLSGLIFTLTYALGMVLSVHVKGTELLFWAYPVTLACFFTVRVLEATTISFCCLGLVLWIIRDQQPLEISARFAVTYLLVALFAFIFARRVNRDRLRLSEEATQDALTGAGNRRALDDEIEAVVVQHKKLPHDVTLLLFDIDFFKTINDSFGHDVGDSFLRRFVQFLAMQIPPSARLYRLGGEEFILINHSSLDEARILGERIRGSLEKTRLIPELSVTVSIGIASLHEGEVGRDWIRRADNALYRAKHEGRNRICIEE
jgi:diguanylate cyclase